MRQFREYCTQVEFDTIVKIKQGQERQTIKAVGNRLSVIDANNRLMEEFTVGRILPATSNNRGLLESSLLKYVDTTVKGHNLLVLTIGTTNSGKETVILGSKSEPGVAIMFIESLFSSLDLASNAKSNYAGYLGSKKESLAYSMRFQFLEIVDEKITDLMSAKKYSPLEVNDDRWEGVRVEGATWTSVKNFAAARQALDMGFKSRINSLNELGESSGKSSTVLIVEVSQKYMGGSSVSSTIVSRAVFCELPGVEVLKDTHQELRIKEEPLSIRSLVGFCTVVKQLGEDLESSPLSETSKLTHVLKDYIGGNAFATAILNVANGDSEGSIKTLRFLKALSMVPQYPIFNNGQSVGLLHRIRLDKAMSAGSGQAALPLSGLQSEKQILESNLAKIRSEDDYKRMLDKYTELKGKYANSMKSKNQIQLQLIRSEEEKLEISKNIVELQIENTRLMEELQGKDYQMGRKMLKAETSMIEKEVANTKYAERIKELEDTLQQAIDGKRDLEVEFIALKKNYITQQKDIQQLKNSNQALGLDVINLNKQSKLLEERTGSKALKGSQSGDYLKDQIAQLQKEKAQLQQNEAYLKAEVERYRNQVVKYELSMREGNPDLRGSSRSSRKGNHDDFKYLELENEKIELNNRVKLLNRRIDELQEMTQHLNEDADQLREQNKRLSELESANTSAYRSKLEKVAQKDTTLAISELKQSFSAVQKRSKQRVQELTKKLQDQRAQARSLAAYSRQLKELAIEYAPKGVPLPSALTDARVELDVPSDTSGEMEKLRTKNRKLEHELSVIKAGSRQASVLSNERINQEINFLKQSQAKETVGAGELEALRNERNSLREENRKLMGMLKDGNKMESATLTRENEILRREVERLKEAKDSVSPNSGDQRLQYYEKHLKKLEKERSELLVRCTVAEEQLKSFQEHYAKKR